MDFLLYTWYFYTIYIYILYSTLYMVLDQKMMNCKIHFIYYMLNNTYSILYSIYIYTHYSLRNVENITHLIPHIHIKYFLSYSMYTYSISYTMYTIDSVLYIDIRIICYSMEAMPVYGAVVLAAAAAGMAFGFLELAIVVPGALLGVVLAARTLFIDKPGGLHVQNHKGVVG